MVHCDGQGHLQTLRRYAADTRRGGNQGDALVHSTKKSLAEHSDKVDPSTVEVIELAASALEDALKTENVGKIKGGSLDCAVVIKGDKIISKEPLRFADEFVRHKILDIIGDLSLVGKPITGHVIAVKPGHGPNTMMAAKLKTEYARMRSMVPASLRAATMIEYDGFVLCASGSGRAMT